MKLAVADFVVREHLVQKLRKDASAVLKKQIAVGRGRRNHDIAALLGLGLQVAAQHAVHGVHGLRTAAEGENRRVRLCRIEAVRQDDLVVHGRAGDLLRLVEDLRAERLDHKTGRPATASAGTNFKFCRFIVASRFTVPERPDGARAASARQGGSGHWSRRSRDSRAARRARRRTGSRTCGYRPEGIRRCRPARRACCAP